MVREPGNNPRISPGPMFLDRQLCSAQLGNSRVIVPLLSFCIANASEAPMADIQWMGIMGAKFIGRVFGLRGREVRVVVVRSWQEDR